MTVYSGRLMVTAVLAAALLLIISVDRAHAAAYEPNDSVATATGPLQSGVDYTAAIETVNDQDWFVFYTTGVTQLDISLLGLHPEECFGPEVALSDASGETIEQSHYAARNETEHILYTAPKAGTYYLSVYEYHIAPCAGSDALYRLRIDASIPLGVSPPPVEFPPVASTPQAPDAGRRARCAGARRRLARLNAQLQRAASPRQRRRLRSMRRQARQRVRSAC